MDLSFLVHWQPNSNVEDISSQLVPTSKQTTENQNQTRATYPVYHECAKETGSGMMTPSWICYHRYVWFNMTFQSASKSGAKGGIKSGYLTKKGAFVKNWKERYWVLNYSTLSYYKSATVRFLANTKGKKQTIDLTFIAGLWTSGRNQTPWLWSEWTSSRRGGQVLFWTCCTLSNVLPSCQFRNRM